MNRDNIATMLARARCRRRGHDWFPGGEAMEFIPVEQLCLRCGEKTALLPYGTCLGAGGHPLSDHYDAEGHGVVLTECAGPQ